MYTKFSTPMTALAAALLLPAGLGFAPAQPPSPLQLAATLAPTPMAPAAPQNDVQPTRTPNQGEHQAPLNTMQGATPSNNGTPRAAPAGPAAQAPLSTLDQTPSTSKEGVHATPTSPSTGQTPAKP